MPQQLPQTRQQMLELVANLIGWGATAADIAPMADKLEAEGIEFVPSALLPKGFINPFAAKKD